MTRLVALILCLLATEVVMAEPTPIPTIEQRMAAYYDAAAADINRLWLRATEDLLANPESRSGAYREQRAAKLAYEIDRRLRLVRPGAEGILRGVTEDQITAAIQRGDAEADKLGLRRTDLTRGVGFGPDALPGGLTPGFVGFSDEAVRQIAADSTARAVNTQAIEMGRGIDTHGERAKLVFRSISDSVLTADGTVRGELAINKAIARGIVSGDPKITDRAIRDLFRDPEAPQAESARKLGNKLIEVGQATMSVRAYAATVTVTRMREATEAARHTRLGQRGIRLVQITGGQSGNFCSAFLGLICSLDGASEVDGMAVVPLSSLPGGGPPFHPRCSKSTAAVVVHLLSRARIDLAGRAMREFEHRRRTNRLLEPVK